MGRAGQILIADTNVLVRSAVRDDVRQAKLADALLRDSALVAISIQSLCEFVWVLRHAYGLDAGSIALAVRTLVGVHAAVLDRPAVEAGLALLDAGGDFADGVSAHEGYKLGGETFVSFDRKAVKLLQAQGKSARLLA